MLESPCAVAALRSYRSDPLFSLGLPSKDFDPRTAHCFKIRFEVLSGDAALAAFAHIETQNLDLASEASVDRFSFLGLDITGDLSLVTETKIGVSSFVSIEMEIPGYWHSFRCVGSVSWLREHRAQGCFKAGVTFLNVNIQNLKLIEAAIDKFVPVLN